MQGCRQHGITSAQADAWWDKAADTVGAHVGVCCCCSGPSPMVRAPDSEGGDWRGMPYCRKCDEGEDYDTQAARARAGK